jgi:hypothetical protein
MRRQIEDRGLRPGTEDGKKTEKKTKKKGKKGGKTMFRVSEHPQAAT